jgi:hypothetical protein
MKAKSCLRKYKNLEILSVKNTSHVVDFYQASTSAAGPEGEISQTEACDYDSSGLAISSWSEIGATSREYWGDSLMGGYKDGRDKDFGRCPGRENKGGGRQSKGRVVLVVAEAAGKYGLLSVKLEDSNSADCTLASSFVSKRDRLIGFSARFSYNIYIHVLWTVTCSKSVVTW